MFNVTKCIAFLPMQVLTIASIVDLDGMLPSSWSMYIVCLYVGKFVTMTTPSLACLGFTSASKYCFFLII